MMVAPVLEIFGVPARTANGAAVPRPTVAGPVAATVCTAPSIPIRVSVVADRSNLVMRSRVVIMACSSKGGCRRKWGAVARPPVSVLSTAAS